MANTNQNMSTNINVDNENILIPGYSSVEEFTKDGFKTLIEATRNSNSLPQDRDWDFYNTHQSFRDLMSSQGDNILRLINDVLKQQGVQGNIKSRDLEEKIELIIEANDIILERVANNLDEIAGIRKNPVIPVEIQTVSAELPVNGSWNRLNNAKITVASSSAASKQNQTKSPNSVRLLTAKNIQRPQKFFKDKIDNSKAPWEPIIKDKPNNLKPLAIFLEPTDDGLGEIFCHPYEFELERFAPAPWQLTPVPKPVPPPRPLSDTPLHIVDSTEKLESLLETLRQHRRFAVDLEHHSYRSYLGFTCLMQISTAEEDFLVDTLALRTELHVLNEVFTKPTVLKIFHGADHDIEWLQRDLGLYVVNMFDTHQAAKQLGYSGLSLAALLRRFCRVDADKRFQLADWRIRPLPQELQLYAREDTHYLLHIADMMRNELLQRGENVLRAVYTASTQICMKRYSKPSVHETTHLELYRRCKKLFDNRQMYALKELYHWRDDLAREEDESTGFVLPNHMLLQIAELLPREMQGILACCNPIPPLVRSNLLELHRIVLKAREQSIIKPILSEEARSRGSTQQHSKLNIDTALNCPHDLARSDDFRDDLPTLLGGLLQKVSLQSSEKLESGHAQLSVFDEAGEKDQELKKSKVGSKMQRLKFLGPYERYKLVKKYVQAEETKEVQESERKTDEERTDNDRIKALQEHFKTLASTTLQLPPVSDQPKSPEQHTPTSLGQPVAKKRKREPSPEPEPEPVIEPELKPASKQQQQHHQQKQQLQQQQQQQQQQPQKQQLHQQQQQQQQQPNTPGQKSKKKRKKNKNKQNMQNVNEQLHNKQQQPQQNNSKKQNNQQHQNSPKQQQQQNTPKQQHQFNQQRGGKRKSNNNQSEGSTPKRKRETDAGDNFRPFDYSAVDFKQFQGGAGSAQQTKKLSANFRGKGSKNKKFDSIGRTNMRSSTFHGRGRGRGGASRGGW